MKQQLTRALIGLVVLAPLGAIADETPDTPEAAIAAMVPGLEASDVTESPVPGVYEVTGAT